MTIEHEQFADDLALYALDALTGEDQTRIAQHLATCASCRAELERLRGDTALFALSAAGPRPPQRTRQRLLDAVAREARPQVTRDAERRTASRSWWGWWGWAAAAVAIAFAVLLWRQNSSLQQMLTSVDAQAAANARQLEALRKIAEPILEPDTQRVTLVAARAPAQPQGKAFYLRKRNSLVFLANNMPALPAQKAYELWLIPVNGNPIPAGVFKPDASGNATVVNPPLPTGVEAKAFAVTVENDTGSATPTLPIVMMGSG
jgi:anti-sigma-K factor RskA